MISTPAVGMGGSNSARAQALLRGTLTWDNHACMPLDTNAPRFLPQLNRAKRAGCDVIALNVGYGASGVADHVATIARFRDWIARHPAELELVTTVDQLRPRSAEEPLGVFFDIEGMNALGDQPELVGLYYDLGVRWMLIAYNERNRAGSGCFDPNDGGLTKFGRTVIDEMARAGMMLCCSHTGPRTAHEAIDHSANPVIFSHSNAAAVFAHPRNIDDTLIRHCAARGGVIGLNGIGPFLGQGAALEDFRRHLDHLLETVGPSHISFGLDYVYDPHELAMIAASNPAFRGHSKTIEMIEPERMPALVELLFDAGLSELEAGGVLGGNLLRVARQVWRQHRPQLFPPT